MLNMESMHYLSFQIETINISFHIINNIANILKFDLITSIVQLLESSELIEWDFKIFRVKWYKEKWRESNRQKN